METSPSVKIISAGTEEDAVSRAAAELGVAPAELKYTVIDRDPNQTTIRVGEPASPVVA